MIGQLNIGQLNNNLWAKVVISRDLIPKYFRMAISYHNRSGKSHSLNIISQTMGCLDLLWYKIALLKSFWKSHLVRSTFPITYFSIVQSFGQFALRKVKLLCSVQNVKPTGRNNIYGIDEWNCAQFDLKISFVSYIDINPRTVSPRDPHISILCRGILLP